MGASGSRWRAHRNAGGRAGRRPDPDECIALPGRRQSRYGRARGRRTQGPGAVDRRQDRAQRGARSAGRDCRRGTDRSGVAGGTVATPRTIRLRAPDGPVQVRAWPAKAANPEAPVRLAFQGWTDSSEVFAPVVAALKGRWTVVAADAPAHGGTPLRDGPYVIAEHATSAIAVLDALGLPRLAGPGHRTAVAYGHSMGA